MQSSAKILTVLCCWFALFPVSITLALGNDDDLNLGYNQQSSHLQITEDGRQVMFDPENRGISSQQTLHFTQMPHSLQNESYFQSGVDSSAQYLGQSPDTSGGARRGMFQGASVAFSYLPGLGGHGLEMTQIRFGATFGLPAPLENSYIILSPSFEPTFIRWDGWEPFPDTLYSASFNCTLIKRINERWGAMASVGPRWSSDGKETKDSVRCSLMGGMTWDKSRQWQFRFGVIYLNRDDNFNVLPFGGIVWTPNEDWKYDLMLPMLRVARRWHSFPATLSRASESSHWGYFGIGFGGGTWAFRSIGNQSDVANYSEFSVVIGLESKRMERNPWKAELGYVFGRSMKFENHTMRKFPIDDSIVFRIHLSI